MKKILGYIRNIMSNFKINTQLVCIFFVPAVNMSNFVILTIIEFRLDRNHVIRIKILLGIKTSSHLN